MSTDTISFGDSVTQGWTDEYAPMDLSRATEDSDVFESASVRAVGGEYRVYAVPHSSEVAGWYVEYVVIWWPTDGPLDVILKILDNEGRFPNFVRSDIDDRLGDWRAMDAAHNYAMRKASDDVLSELS